MMWLWILRRTYFPPVKSSFMRPRPDYLVSISPVKSSFIRASPDYLVSISPVKSSFMRPRPDYLVSILLSEAKFCLLALFASWLGCGSLPGFNVECVFPAARKEGKWKSQAWTSETSGYSLPFGKRTCIPVFQSEVDYWNWCYWF